jgi:hypothetical protein
MLKMIEEIRQSGSFAPVMRRGAVICAFSAVAVCGSGATASADERPSPSTSSTVASADGTAVKVLGPKRVWDVETLSWRWG